MVQGHQPWDTVKGLEDVQVVLKTCLSGSRRSLRCTSKGRVDRLDAAGGDLGLAVGGGVLGLDVRVWEVEIWVLR